jgi:mannose-6-phosphate isomerase-like protein (cupin superfamily)
MAMEQPYLAPGEGERVSLRGTEVVFKAAGERTGGGPTVLEFITAPGFATGDHVHRTIEEIFCVLDGEFAIRAGDRSERVGPGCFMCQPSHILFYIHSHNAYTRTRTAKPQTLDHAKGCRYHTTQDVLPT